MVREGFPEEEEKLQLAVCVGGISCGGWGGPLPSERSPRGQATGRQVLSLSPRCQPDHKHSCSSYCVLDSVSHTGHTTVTSLLGSDVLVVDRGVRRAIHGAEGEQGLG